MKLSMQEAMEAATVNGAHVLCDRCETGLLIEKAIRTAFWRGEELVIIRNIPAMVCPFCGEEYVADRTANGLDRMRAAGFAPTGGGDRMVVPVLNYVDPGLIE